jgi:hypothetical protein
MLIDFRCSQPDCREVHEEWVATGTRSAVCPKCFSISYRIVSPVRSVLDPISGHFPSATDKWAKHHEEAAKRPKDR